MKCNVARSNIAVVTAALLANVGSLKHKTNVDSSLLAAVVSLADNRVTSTCNYKLINDGLLSEQIQNDLQ